MKENPGTDLFRSLEFKSLRNVNKRKFELEMSSKRNPFNKLFSYLQNRSDYYEAQVNKWRKDHKKKVSPKLLEVNYEDLLKLIPEEYSVNAPNH